MKNLRLNIPMIILALLVYSGLCLGKEPNISWSYTGNTGESFWGQLASSYKLCASGQQQSPINIQNVTKKQSNRLNFFYDKALPTNKDIGYPAGSGNTLINNGHTLQLNFKQGVKKYFSFNGEKYYLLQLHFHSPSENLVNGESFPVEMHLVHRSSAGRLAVVGVFIKQGNENPELSKLLNNLPPVKKQLYLLNDLNINLLKLLPANRAFYSFPGSLTTPPCSEGVEWLVMAKPVEASLKQIAKLKHAIGMNNARSVQPLNGRIIFSTFPS